MGPTDQLIPALKKLRLSGVLESLELRLRQAAEDDLSHSEFLYRLFNDEVERRDTLFGDPLLASAAMDRLLHYAEVLTLEGESFRNPSRAKRKKESLSQEQPGG